MIVDAAEDSCCSPRTRGNCLPPNGLTSRPTLSINPAKSVKQADGLVVDIMQRVTAGFSHERERLEAQWEQGDDVSTEDLRVALTRYRSFFDRLIST